ncbi:MAG TPA: ATP-binding protein [Bryobacteraceae bacterium]|nr:ATP-binding protein [Bryobacteraceae bacterium]
MNLPMHYPFTDAISDPWLQVLRDGARSIALPYEPVACRLQLEGTAFLMAARALGAQTTPVEPFDQWTLEPRTSTRRQPGEEFVPDLLGEGIGARDFQGLVRVDLEGKTYLALRTDWEYKRVRVEKGLVLGVPSLEEGLALSGRLLGALKRLAHVRPRVFGTPLDVASGRDVSEDDVILPRDFKADLFGYLDGFRRAARLCAELRITPNRGVLFVGRPGTGKTMVIRHLMSRFGEMRRLIYVNDLGQSRNDEMEFRSVVRELNADPTPALVVIEDVDRLLQSGTVAPELFLNVLDGLLEPSAPTLWIATSNDPTGLEDNLLDRPGRFDRVFVFPLPGLEQRARLVERYSPYPVPELVVRSTASRTEELSAAHLREICVSAALACAGDAERYCEHLDREVVRVQEQHRQSRRYHAAIRREERVGFGG